MNLQSALLVWHENDAVGPKNAAMKSACVHGFAAHEPFGLNVPPVTVPLM